MEKCPYCGSEDGVFTTYTGKQYYYWNGEPCGYNADVPDNQRKFVRCIIAFILIRTLPENGKFL